MGPILIVDDEASNLAVLREVLKDDYKLVFARNGAEMLGGVAKHRPALVLLDVEMPDMDGLSACQALKANPKTENVPVIFVTSHSEIADEAKGFAAGAVDYITKPISAPIVRARVRSQLSLVQSKLLEQSYFDAISMLGEASMFKDTDTGNHIWRMASYCEALALASGWNKDQAAEFRYSASMHDIGKLGIPDSILFKPDKLTEQEMVIMQTHTTIGFEILSKSHGTLLQTAATIAHYHHEKWDGTGYPSGRGSTDIPEAARIVSICDVFDALSIRRPYKQAWPPDQVYAFLEQNRGHHFDPGLIDCFMDNRTTIETIQSDYGP
jgi:putative two-component system response regulator